MRRSAPHADRSLQDQDHQAAAHAAQAQGHHILQQQRVLSAHVRQIWCRSRALYHSHEFRLISSIPCWQIAIPADSWR